MSTIILPLPGHFDATNPPGYEKFNSKPRILFDDTTPEFMHWTFRMPSDYSSSLVAKIQYSMVSAIANEIVVAVEVYKISDGATAAIDTDSYATANTSSAITVPGTAGYPDEISLTLTNDDGVAANDWTAVRFSRDADAAGDDATGDMELVAISLEYTAA